MQATQLQARVTKIESIEKLLRIALAELGRLRAEMRDESGHVVTVNAGMTITPVVGVVGVVSDTRDRIMGNGKENRASEA